MTKQAETLEPRELTSRQIYYKLYYQQNKQHIIQTVLKYQSENQQAKRDYYTKYNRIYYLRRKQMNPDISKKNIVLETLNGDVPKQLKEPKKVQKKIKEIATISAERAPKAIKSVAKYKPQFEMLRGSFVLSFN